MKKILLIIAISSTIALTGCGNKKVSEIIPDVVSGYKYKKMSCDELEHEIDFLQRSANKAAGIVDSIKDTQDDKDVAAFLLFWPALFLTDDNKAEAQKYSELKGEHEAALRAHRINKC